MRRNFQHTRHKMKKTLTLSANATALLLSLYTAVVFNIGYWQKVWQQTVGIGENDYWLLGTMPFFLMAAFYLFWQLMLLPHLHRLLVPLLLILGAGASYAVMVQGIYFNSEQIDNILQTNPTEASAWISVPFLGWVALVGILPALLYTCCLKVRTNRPLFRRVLWRLVGMAAPIVVTALIAAVAYQNYASFYRNNKVLNHLIVPINFVGASFKAAYNAYDARRPFEPIGLDAKRTASDSPRKNLLVIVVGETTRAQNWGLNDGAPDTTPQLAQRTDIVNFTNVTSCGTSTAISVPCMFSKMNRANYDGSTAKHQENLMDILKRVNLYTNWHENDGGCKGVCDRIPNNNTFQTIADAATQCKGNLCYDTALLENLPQEIDRLPNDGVIVLHTTGSHGPAYYERYPDALRRFTPTCDTNQIQNCNHDQLVNTYNNTILAVDDMLAKTIGILQNRSDLNTALLYLSDHGESLGENGIYLHAAPYAVAPPQQTRIPMIFWASPSFYADNGIDAGCLKQRRTQPYSHDNLFHSVLGLFRISTQEYRADLDLFAACLKPQ